MGGGLIRAAIVVVAIVVLLVGLMWLFQRRIIYLPYGDPGEPPTGATEVTLKTGDGLRLRAWHWSADSGPTVMVAGGNAGNRSMRVPLAEALVSERLGVLLLDYRGYGGNPGGPSADGLARDVRAARDYLVNDAGVGEDRLIYFGESLGGGPMAELATEHPPAGLVLRSPFTELASVGQRHYPYLPVRLLLWDRYPVAEQVRDLDVPVLVAYGSRDTIVPPEESRAVAAAAQDVEEVTVEGADHNDWELLAGDELISAVATFAHRNA